MGSRAVERIAAVDFLRTHQFAEDAGPMAHPVRPDEYLEINNFYTDTVYEKGAEVIRMLHTLLGPERFRRGMDLYFARHDGQAVTCDDFVQAMQDAARGADGADPTSRSSGAGTRRPARRSSTSAAATTPRRGATRSTSRSAARRRRGQPDEGAVPHPAGGRPASAPTGATCRCVVAGAAGGRRRHDPRAARDGGARRVLLRRRRGAAGAVAAARLLRARHAGVRLPARRAGAARRARQRSVLPLGRGAAQLRARDARCRAAARAAAAARARSRAPSPSPGSSSPTAARDPALRALALAPPDFAYLASRVDAIDIDALAAARAFVTGELARALREPLSRLHADLRARGPVRVHAGAGRRARARQPLPRLPVRRSTTRRRARSPWRSTTRPTT